MSNADKQVGGNHYVKMKHQPLQQVLDDMGIEYFRGACVCKLLKYIKRDKGNTLENYKKAQHVLNWLVEEEEKLYEKTNN